jgi:hypothetical protein
MVRKLNVQRKNKPKRILRLPDISRLSFSMS